MTFQMMEAPGIAQSKSTSPFDEMYGSGISDEKDWAIDQNLAPGDDGFPDDAVLFDMEN